jgi:hypothetical protein
VCDYFKDHAIIVSHDIVAIDFTPLVAVGRPMEVASIPVIHAMPAIPILMPNVLSFLPVIVMNSLIVVLLGIMMILVIMVVLGEGSAAQKGQAQGTYCYSFKNRFHLLSPPYPRFDANLETTSGVGVQSKMLM